MAGEKGSVADPLSIRGGRLFIDECDAAELADRFGTPLFVVSETKILDNYRRYASAFEKCWPEGRVRVMASIKANPITAIVKLLGREGAGCDTFGAGELELALRGGIDPANIAVNGSIKSRAIIRRAIELGLDVILDSPAELEYCEEEAAGLGLRCRALYRVKPWLGDLDVPSDFFPERLIRDMTQTAKYGIPNSELMQMLRRSPELEHVDFVGVHMHMGRHSKRSDVWAKLIESFVERVATIREHLGSNWAPSIVSFGGGMAADADLESRVTVTDYETPKAIEYAEFITSAFRVAMKGAGIDCSGITIEIEPGRALFNDAGIHLARVHNVKHETENLDRRWVETDTSECFLSVGSLNLTSPFPYRVANKANAENEWTADIAGITCNYECLAEQVPLPAVEAGDVLAFLNTGSYIEVYGCNFNGLPRPGVLLVSGDDADMIKRAESLDDVFARDILPARLA